MELTTLKNGTRLVVIPLKGIRSVTLESHIKIGSKYESEQEHGLSHFLEHMAFKGTVKRPNPTDIFREMDSVGADFNAETGYEDTSYRITTIRSNLNWAAEMMSDILSNSRMPEEEVEKERGVVIEEIKMYQDNPMIGLGSDLTKWLYGKSGIGCWNISGEIGDIKAVSRQRLLKYRQKYFCPRGTVIVVAGNIKSTDVGILEDYFGQERNDGNSSLPKVKVKLNQVKKFYGKRKVEQAHLAMALPTFGSLDKRRYALRLVDIIMAGNTSSRLFEEVRSKRGWAYYVFSVSESINEAGYWGVQLGVATERLEEVLELVEREILNIKDWLKSTEINRTKAYLRGKIELLFDRSDFWTGYVGQKLLQEERLVDPVTELKEIEKVELTDILEMAETFFIRSELRKYIISK